MFLLLLLHLSSEQVLLDAITGETILLAVVVDLVLISGQVEYKKYMLTNKG